MNRGKPVKWRKTFQQLIARPIPTSEYPRLAKDMYEDGLFCLLTLDGLQWYSGRYPVAKKVVRDLWSLSKAQFIRFERWVYMNDPYSKFAEEEAEQDE